MATCKTCRFFRLINTKTGSGKCGAEPKSIDVSSDRYACRHYDNKDNFLPESEGHEMIYEETR